MLRCCANYAEAEQSVRERHGSTGEVICIGESEIHLLVEKKTAFSSRDLGGLPINCFRRRGASFITL